MVFRSIRTTFKLCSKVLSLKKKQKSFGFLLTYSYLCTQNLKKMNIEALISKAAQEAVKALYGMDATEKMVQLQKRRSEIERPKKIGDWRYVK